MNVSKKTSKMLMSIAFILIALALIFLMSLMAGSAFKTDYPALGDLVLAILIGFGTLFIVYIIDSYCSSDDDRTKN
jgi:hypothetical protein